MDTSGSDAKSSEPGSGAAGGDGSGRQPAAEVEDVVMEDVDEDVFSLSRELAAHQNIVRCVAADGSDLIVTAETDGLVHRWVRKDDGGDFQHNIIFDEPVHGHQKLMFALEPVKDFPGTFVSGGNDNAAHVWSVDGSKQLSMMGHSGAVNSICQTNNGHFVTGSFDTTAKVWKRGKNLATLEGHQYGVEVCTLMTGEIVTGSHQDINLWKHGKIVKKIQQAHDHVIRRIVRHSLGFATCANDGFVKIWSSTGENLLAINAHPVQGETASFVYSMAVLSDGRIISVGEDRTAKIWNQDGSLAQSIDHPSSVRCVCALPNGDFVTGSDITARIFTRKASRKANDQAIIDFINIVQASKAPEGGDQEDMETLNPQDYPGMEALEQEGADGQMVIVNAPGKGPTVFKYSSHESKWEEIGQAIGQPKQGDSIGRRNTGKAWLEGVAYDHVTHVDMDGKNKIGLGFNVDDDPIDVARGFCERYSLDKGMHMPEIVAHLQKLSDPVARAKRLEREAQARRNAFKQVPSWRRGGFDLQTSSKPDAMKAKIEEFNKELLQENNVNAMPPKSPQKQLFNDLIAIISDTSSYHVGTFSPALRQLLVQLLHWPTSKVLPVMDAIRVLMCHSGALSTIGDDDEIRKLLFDHVSHDDATQHHLMVLCRTASNWIAKRPRSEEERKSTDPPEHVVTYLNEVLNHTANAVKSKSKAVYTSYVMLAYNVIIWYGKYKVPESGIYLQVIEALFQLLDEERSEKAFFYSLLTIGTIAFVSQPIVKYIKERHAAALHEHVNSSNGAQNRALNEIAFDLKKLFEIQ